jgi:hypothetical protein
LQQQLHVRSEIGTFSLMSGKIHAIIVGMIPVFDIKGKNIAFWQSAS